MTLLEVLAPLKEEEYMEYYNPFSKFLLKKFLLLSMSPSGALKSLKTKNVWNTLVVSGNLGQNLTQTYTKKFLKVLNIEIALSFTYFQFPVTYACSGKF